MCFSRYASISLYFSVRPDSVRSRSLKAQYTHQMCFCRKKKNHTADWAGGFTHTRRKSDPFHWWDQFFSQLSHCKQTHHPITMVVKNRSQIICRWPPTVAAAELVTFVSRRQALSRKWDAIYSHHSSDLKDNTKHHQSVGLVRQLLLCLLRWIANMCRSGLELSHRHPWYSFDSSARRWSSPSILSL